MPGGRRPVQRLRRIAPAAIAVAIAVVASAQWLLAIHHVHLGGDPRPRLPSWASSWASGSNAAGRRRRGRRPPPPRPRRSDDYLTSELCGGCTRSFFDSRPCFTIIERDVQKKRARSLTEAARKLGRESENCALCDPDRCRDYYLGNSTHASGGGSGSGSGGGSSGGRRSKYWRFDRTHPSFSSPTTLALPSIPSKLRIPPERFEDAGKYFAEKHEFLKETNSSMDYLVEYNPGLAIIPSKMKERLPVGATYLLSLRVTPANNCFSEKTYAELPQEVWNAVYHTSTNHLGLALLDEEYRLIPGYDVVIELDEQLDLKRSTTSKAGEAVSPTFMDYRLFALNDEIYLHANADTVVVNRLSLEAKGFGGDDNGLHQVQSCRSVSEEAGSMGSWDVPCLLDNLYGGDRLRVTLMRQFNTVWSGGSIGKNYALFGIPYATHPDSPDAIYAEVDIFPHRVQHLILDEFDQITKKRVFEHLWKPGTKKRRQINFDRVNMRMAREVGNATVGEDRIPLPSFFALDSHEDWFPGQDAPFKEGAHGGACCVHISADQMRTYRIGRGGVMGAGGDGYGPLLVGIGHTKVTWKPWYSRKNVPQERKDRVPHTHYVSLFYAFEPQSPFRVRARSGYFCLGHAPPAAAAGGGENRLPSMEGGTFNPHSVLTRNRMLRQNNITFDCPQMHFVSTFVEKAGAPDKTVVGYGLNDCTPRLVEVDKAEIVRLLFPDPMDMIFE
ncbi:hypothetical protein ACHAWF_013155 [Thalassiosira exigua]